MYQEQKLRESSRADFLNLREYLESLGLKIAIQKNSKELVSRISQLCQRTNQFNLTNTRYSEREVKNLMASEDHDVLSLRASDKFGDYGVTAVAIVEYRNHDNSAAIRSFFLSCRIIGRDIELALVNYVMGMLEKAGVEIVFASYIASERNRQVSDFFQRIGFSVVGIDGENKEYKIALQEYKPRELDYIRIDDGN